jgi:uncharacterized protein YprB with RNaseH-like and TPR domain
LGLARPNVAVNQIHKDWYVIAWSAKWYGDPASKTLYRDQRNAKNIENDKEILKDLWKLLDEADIVITQNGKNFDSPKIERAVHSSRHEAAEPVQTLRHLSDCPARG